MELEEAKRQSLSIDRSINRRPIEHIYDLDRFLALVSMMQSDSQAPSVSKVFIDRFQGPLQTQENDIVEVFIHQQEASEIEIIYCLVGGMFVYLTYLT